MLKIGEFSKMSRISVRMLRYYDEIGLLKPAEIDRFTEYRYYREDQLPTAGRIAALKDIPFWPLKESGQKPACGGYAPSGLGEYDNRLCFFRTQP